MNRSLVPLVSGLFALLPTAASALDAVPPADHWRVVPDEVLEAQRGGFFGTEGMQIAFGLEQSTTINGETVHHTVIRELGPLAPTRGVDGPRLEGVTIRTGVDGHDVRRLGAGDLGDGFGWVTSIQNQLDGQDIRHETRMQLELGDVRMPSSDMGRALQGQLTEGARSGF